MTYVLRGDPKCFDACPSGFHLEQLIYITSTAIDAFMIVVAEAAEEKMK